MVEQPLCFSLRKRHQKPHLQQIGAFRFLLHWKGGPNQHAAKGLSSADRRASSICWSGRGAFSPKREKPDLQQIGTFLHLLGWKGWVVFKETPQGPSAPNRSNSNQKTAEALAQRNSIVQRPDENHPRNSGLVKEKGVADNVVLLCARMSMWSNVGSDPTSLNFVFPTTSVNCTFQINKNKRRPANYYNSPRYTIW